MMDVKELILAGAEAAKNIGIGQLVWANEHDSEVWKDAFNRVAECRKRCLESMSNPRVRNVICTKYVVLLKQRVALRRRNGISILAGKKNLFECVTLC